MFDISLILRGFQLFCCLIITALVGNVIATNVNAAGSAEAAVNFAMFVAVLSWLAAIVGIAGSFVSALGNGMVRLLVDVVASLFTFIGAVVLAAKLRVPNCADLDRKALGDAYIAFGSLDDQKRCRELQASTVFMWFLFAAFVATMVFSFLSSRRGMGGSVRSGPSMAQVRV